MHYENRFLGTFQGHSKRPKTESEQTYELILSVGDGNIEESECSEQFTIQASRDEGFACLYTAFGWLILGVLICQDTIKLLK
jgi:hypothetical protein